MSSHATTSTPITEPTTIVLVDSTSADGETSLAAIGDDVRHVSVVTLLDGRQSTALREYANAEGIDLVSAAWNYLEQVAERIGRDGRTVETITATGPDTAFELAVIAGERQVERIVLPSSVARAERRIADRLSRSCDASIVVAELVAT